MTAVTGTTFLFNYRFMLKLIFINFILYFRMAIETDLSRFVLDEISLIGAVCTVTG